MSLLVKVNSPEYPTCKHPETQLGNLTRGVRFFENRDPIRFEEEHADVGFQVAQASSIGLPEVASVRALSQTSPYRMTKDYFQAGKSASHPRIQILPTAIFEGFNGGQILAATRNQVHLQYAYAPRRQAALMKQKMLWRLSGFLPKLITPSQEMQEACAQLDHESLQEQNARKYRGEAEDEKASVGGDAASAASAGTSTKLDHEDRSHDQAQHDENEAAGAAQQHINDPTSGTRNNEEVATTGPFVTSPVSEWRDPVQLERYARRCHFRLHGYFLNDDPITTGERETGIRTRFRYNVDQTLRLERAPAPVVPEVVVESGTTGGDGDDVPSIAYPGDQQPCCEWCPFRELKLFPEQDYTPVEELDFGCGFFSEIRFPLSLKLAVTEFLKRTAFISSYGSSALAATRTAGASTQQGTAKIPRVDFAAEDFPVPGLVVRTLRFLVTQYKQIQVQIIPLMAAHIAVGRTKAGRREGTNNTNAKGDETSSGSRTVTGSSKESSPTGRRRRPLRVSDLIALRTGKGDTDHAERVLRGPFRIIDSGEIVVSKLENAKSPGDHAPSPLNDDRKNHNEAAYHLADAQAVVRDCLCVSLHLQNQDLHDDLQDLAAAPTRDLERSTAGTTATPSSSSCAKTSEQTTATLCAEVLASVFHWADAHVYLWKREMATRAYQYEDRFQKYWDSRGRWLYHSETMPEALRLDPEDLGGIPNSEHDVYRKSEADETTKTPITQFSVRPSSSTYSATSNNIHVSPSTKSSSSRRPAQDKDSSSGGTSTATRPLSPQRKLQNEDPSSTSSPFPFPAEKNFPRSLPTVFDSASGHDFAPTAAFSESEVFREKRPLNNSELLAHFRRRKRKQTADKSKPSLSSQERSAPGIERPPRLEEDASTRTELQVEQETTGARSTTYRDVDDHTPTASTSATTESSFSEQEVWLPDGLPLCLFFHRADSCLFEYQSVTWEEFFESMESCSGMSLFPHLPLVLLRFGYTEEVKTGGGREEDGRVLVKAESSNSRNRRTEESADVTARSAGYFDSNKWMRYMVEVLNIALA
ncbi:unnamed protein product [Amoebophrya sp. A120]|nr:unnamed protein product [Amoebophrya sp. A120]|eukprot:GSA120T00012202001.1